MRRRNVVIMPVVLLLAMLACNVPIGQDAGGTNATITALAATIQAQATAAGYTDTPGPTSAVPSATPTITPTATPTVPMVSVSQTTNCRSGPGTDYDLLGSLGPGQSVQVLGKYTPANYVIIDTPGSSGTCWLWGQYATYSGDMNSIPEVAAPPTPTPGPTATPELPAAPSKFKSSASCSSGGLLSWNVHVVLTWTDNASNEDGYYLYRNDALLVTLAADAIKYTDDTSLGKLYKIGDPPPSISYSLRAFNSAGKSPERNLSVSCP